MFTSAASGGSLQTGMSPDVLGTPSSGYGVQGGIPSSVFAPSAATGTLSSAFVPTASTPSGTHLGALGAQRPHPSAPSTSASFGGARPRTVNTVNFQASKPTSSSGGGHRPNRGLPGASGGSAALANNVDAWIDHLDENVPTYRPHPGINPTAPDVAVAFLVQQQLPRPKIPEFNGSPTAWVDFITKFRDMVHDQSYLNDRQRSF